MEIKNSTKWSTDDLRKLFRRCVKEVDKVEKPSFPFHKRNKHFQLDILNSNRSGFSGRAILNGYRIMVKIPMSVSLVKDENQIHITDREKLAKVMIHEYYHTIGCMGQDKNNYKNDWTKRWDTDFVKDYPIREKVIVKKPKADIRLVRYQRAIKNLRRAETRLKRAKTIHCKWKNKVKYYQKICNFN